MEGSIEYLFKTSLGGIYNLKEKIVKDAISLSGNFLNRDGAHLFNPHIFFSVTSTD